MKGVLFFLLTHSLLTAHCYASSGASFLKIPVGARAAGMGNAYTGVGGDLNAIYWNPAGLSGLNRKEAGFMHAELFAGARYNFLGFALPIANSTEQRAKSEGQKNNSMLYAKSSKLVLGVGAVYLSQGSIEARDENRRKTGDFSANDLAVNLSVSRIISKRSSLGITIKTLRQSIESEKAAGWAMDLGLLTKTPRLTLGAALQNIGPKMKFVNENYSLPLTIATGLGYHLKSGLTLSFDVKHHLNEKSSSLSFGGEWPVLGMLSLRAGYLSTLAFLQKTGENDTNSLLKQFSGIAAGLGFKVKQAQIDYAFSPAGELGVTQKISMTFKFQ